MTFHRISVYAAPLIAMALATPASAATDSSRTNWYLGASGDITWLSHSDTGGGGNVALGYRNNNWRLEGEVGYHGAGGDNGYSSTHYFTYMGNMYYDFNSYSASDSGWHVVPFIGGGIGDAAIHRGNSSLTTTFHHNVNSFAYQGMAGLALTSSSMPSTDWLIGYRYLGTSEHNVHANNVGAGLRINF